MKKYYLHIGTENSGPFDLEELKIKKITKKTPVWFEGLENWKHAEDIIELKNIFATTPPPIASFQPQQSIPNTFTQVETDKADNTKEEKIFGLSKNTFFFGLTFLILTIATFVFNSYQENRNRELEKRNHKTEAENHQFELQQRELKEQKTALEEQQRLEAERLKNEKKISDSNRLIEIQNIISLTNENLENAKVKLENASSFKLLRTAAEKKEQMEDLKNEINSYLIQIENLKKESNQLKLVLEKNN